MRRVTRGSPPRRTATRSGPDPDPRRAGPDRDACQPPVADPRCWIPTIGPLSVRHGGRRRSERREHERAAACRGASEAMGRSPAESDRARISRDDSGWPSRRAREGRDAPTRDDPPTSLHPVDCSPWQRPPKISRPRPPSSRSRPRRTRSCGRPSGRSPTRPAWPSGSRCAACRRVVRLRPLLPGHLRRRRGRRPPRPGRARDRHPGRQHRPPAGRPARVVRGGRRRSRPGQPEHADARGGVTGRPARDPGQGHHGAAGPAGRRRARAGGQPVHRQPRRAGRPRRARTRRTAPPTCGCPAAARGAPCRR